METGKTNTKQIVWQVPPGERERDGQRDYRMLEGVVNGLAAPTIERAD